LGQSARGGRGRTREIVVASVSLADLFKGGRIFSDDRNDIQGHLHIPEYQRPYRWDEAQLKRLVSDLEVFFSAANKRSTPNVFYLGSVVLHQRVQKEPFKRYLDIIDGQQRLTTIALLASVLNQHKWTSDLKFSAPESQNRIIKNLAWFRSRYEHQPLPEIDLAKINVTLVVTSSEDDAYRFFETQNTGGKRLGGRDIIKAFHLRAVSARERDAYAKSWENLTEIQAVIDSVMRVRLWNSLRWRELASERDPVKVRDQIVFELAEDTTHLAGDMGYQQIAVDYSADRRTYKGPRTGYDVRQPISAGVNSIHYLTYLHSLQHAIFHKKSSHIADETSDIGQFHALYCGLVIESKGSIHLERFYRAAILLYVSRFGVTHLVEAGLHLFRVIFSKRLENQRVIRESTAQSHAYATPVMDWIGSSYSHAELMKFCTEFEYKVDTNNLKENGVKGKFYRHVKKYFSIEDEEDSAKGAARYDMALLAAINRRVLQHKGGQ
jgi:hypothetical protein